MVFKVFPLDRVQQRRLPPKKRLSERIVEQIVDPVSSGRLHGSLPGQGSSSSQSPAGDEDRADEPGEGFFSHFSPKIKLASHSGSELLPESSPSTPAAQLEVAPLPTVWQAPPGVEVVWIGERTEEGVCYWHRDKRVSTFDLPPLLPGWYTNTGRRAVLAVSRSSSP